jgi:acetyltransferase
MAKSSATGYRSAARPPPRLNARNRSALAKRAATRPEPTQAIATTDGRRLLLRPIHPQDAAALRRAFDRLTAEQIRARFFHRMNELGDELAQRLCHVDRETGAAFVVTDAPPAATEIRGEARMHVDPVAQAGEFALAVDPAFIGQGLGSALLQRLIAECRKRGLVELWGDVLADNHAMLQLVRHLGSQHSIEQGDEAGLIRVRLAVPPAAR